MGNAQTPQKIFAQDRGRNITPLRCSTTGVLISQDPSATLIVPAMASFATPYSAGDCLGTKITMSTVVNEEFGGGFLRSITITDRANQKQALTVFIFDSDLSGSTVTDNSAVALSSADDAKILAAVSIVAGDYVTCGSKAYGTKAGLDVPLRAITGQTLYALVVTNGTPTYAAAADLQIRLGISQS